MRRTWRRDGREGLARFDPLVHQVVVTDFLMPGLTGLEIAEAIRARSRTTPIVLISGSAEQPRRAAGRGGGAALPAQAGLLRAVQGGAGGGRRACRSGAVGRVPSRRSRHRAINGGRPCLESGGAGHALMGTTTRPGGPGAHPSQDERQHG